MNQRHDLVFSMYLYLFYLVKSGISIKNNVSHDTSTPKLHRFLTEAVGWSFRLQWAGDCRRIRRNIDRRLTRACAANSDAFYRWSKLLAVTNTNRFPREIWKNRGIFRSTLSNKIIYQRISCWIWFVFMLDFILFLLCFHNSFTFRIEPWARRKLKEKSWTHLHSRSVDYLPKNCFFILFYTSNILCKEFLYLLFIPINFSNYFFLLRILMWTKEKEEIGQPVRRNVVRKLEAALYRRAFGPMWLSFENIFKGDPVIFRLVCVFLWML